MGVDPHKQKFDECAKILSSGLTLQGTNTPADALVSIKFRYWRGRGGRHSEKRLSGLAVREAGLETPHRDQKRVRSVRFIPKSGDDVLTMISSEKATSSVVLRVKAIIKPQTVWMEKTLSSVRLLFL
jgi:hypothetical protein